MGCAISYLTTVRCTYGHDSVANQRFNVGSEEPALEPSGGRWWGVVMSLLQLPDNFGLSDAKDRKVLDKFVAICVS